MTRRVLTANGWQEVTRRRLVAYDFVREVTEYVGEIVLWDDRDRAEAAVAAHGPGAIRSSRRGRRPRDGLTVFAMADGAMVGTRSEEGGAVWRENRLGVAFRSDRLVERTLDDGTVERGIGERERVCTAEGIGAFGPRPLRAMPDNGLEDASFACCMGDGAKLVRGLGDGVAPNATFALDLSHLEESATEFARHLFAGDKSKYHPWWKAVCAELEAGRWRDVLARPEVARHKDEDTPEGVCDLYRCVWRNRDSIGYPTYRARGLFVGGGAIESGNKTVMRERMRRAGMQWREDCAESLLALRAAIRSGKWESRVVPLVRGRYRTHHLLEGNVREAQRRSHVHGRCSDASR